jgi:hypothetical protein
VVLLVGVLASETRAQQVPARRFVLLPATALTALPASDLGALDVADLALAERRARSAPRDSVVRAHPAKMVVGGLIGGAAGLYLGGLFGANLSGGGLSSNDVGGGDSWNDLGNALLFGAIGESLGMALGIHMANGRRGSYWRDAIAVAGTGFILLIPAATIDNAWVIIPVAQLWSGIVVERRTTR